MLAAAEAEAEAAARTLIVVYLLSCTAWLCRADHHTSYITTRVLAAASAAAPLPAAASASAAADIAAAEAFAAADFSDGGT